MLPLGAGLLFVGGFAMWMMSITGVIPRRFFREGGWRKEHDPAAWQRYMYAYATMAGVGAVLVLVGFLRRL